MALTSVFSYTREGALRRVLLATTYLGQERPELDQALAHGGRAIMRRNSWDDTPPGPNAMPCAASAALVLLPVAGIAWSLLTH
ncbi:hypothetical protein SMC26_40795 [Actinomadura fulvescens]|uniref:Uncharacterized protein n=1 Tax=Actinomadura fulvescens TaxID=46160 RepID=A0ABN3QZX4_9ACTN